MISKKTQWLLKCRAEKLVAWVCCHVAHLLSIPCPQHKKLFQLKKQENLPVALTHIHTEKSSVLFLVEKTMLRRLRILFPLTHNPLARNFSERTLEKKNWPRISLRPRQWEPFLTVGSYVSVLLTTVITLNATRGFWPSVFWCVQLWT